MTKEELEAMSGQELEAFCYRLGRTLVAKNKELEKLQKPLIDEILAMRTVLNMADELAQKKIAEASEVEEPEANLSRSVEAERKANLKSMKKQASAEK